MAMTTPHTAAAHPSLTARIADVLVAIARRMAEASDGARAARHAGYLAGLTDRQLAERGLTRDAIVAHAFRHLAWR